MEVNREVLAVGLLANVSSVNLLYPRKILCAYDINNTRVSYDVINEEIEYPIYRPRLQSGFFATHTIFLNEILEKLGYPEILEDVHITRIMNEDFEKVFIDTGFLETLFNIAQEEMLPKHMDNDFELLKVQFNLSRSEIEKKANKKQKQNVKEANFNN